MASRLLFIEDDQALGKQVVAQLEKQGYAVTWLREGRLLDAEDVRGVDMVIVDLMLPGTYGMDIIKSLRGFSEIPIMVLSARVDSHDKVRALKLGADDYMTKPFWPEELSERLRARLRRPALQRGDALAVGVVRLDRARREAFVRDRLIELTPVELGLLEALMVRGGEAVTRQALVDKVLAPDGEGGERTLDVHVSRLRKKLGEEGVIETVWGVGYRIAKADRR